METAEKNVNLLEECISHWLSNRDIVLKTKPGESIFKNGFSFTTSSCPLCSEYNNDNEHQSDDCFGCPIQLYTKKQYCNNTPYVCITVFIKRNSGESPNSGKFRNQNDLDRLAELCEDEVKFLQKLFEMWKEYIPQEDEE